jgi:hypothetical protein
MINHVASLPFARRIDDRDYPSLVLIGSIDIKAVQFLLFFLLQYFTSFERIVRKQAFSEFLRSKDRVANGV